MNINKDEIKDGADLRNTDLRNAILRGADLRNAILRGADLRGADLRNTDLRNAILRGAILRNAILRNAILTGADLTGADLRDAILRGADLRDAKLRGADLTGADLTGADLRNAILTGADLTGADLMCVKWDYKTIGINISCPQTGSFIAYKKCGQDIVKLFVPSSALRLSATTRKCRVSKAKVLSITNNKTTITSDYDDSFVYTVGKYVSVKDFDKNRWNECSTGIHCFIDRHDAETWEG